jgi:hypothetical protein
MRSTSDHEQQSIEVTQKGTLEEDETFLPPRNVVHPAESEKLLRIFYLSLLWIFIFLVAGLLFWGWQRLKGEA